MQAFFKRKENENIIRKKKNFFLKKQTFSLYILFFKKISHIISFSF